MKFSLSIPALVAEARAQVRFKRQQIPAPLDLIVEIGIFMLVFWVCSTIFQTAASFVTMFPVLLSSESFKSVLTSAAQEGSVGISTQDFNIIINQLMDMPLTTVAGLFATVGTIAGVIIYVRFIERRKLATMGFRRGHIAREYLMGLLVGTVMFSTAVGIAVISGSLVYGGLAGASVGLIVLFFMGYLVQGLSEEVLSRGYLLVTLARRQHLAIAVFVSACFFGAMHLGNNAVSTLAIANIILFGIFEAIYLLKRGNIWGVAAIHSAWNFIQGNVFGISVSGMPLQPSVFLFEPSGGANLFNGGAFGLEASLPATIVLIAGIVIALLLKNADPPPTTLAAPTGQTPIILLPGAKPLT